MLGFDFRLKLIVLINLLIVESEAADFGLYVVKETGERRLVTDSEHPLLLRYRQKTSWNNSNKVLVIQRRGRVVTDYKNWQKVCLVHYN